MSALHLSFQETQRNTKSELSFTYYGNSKQVVTNLVEYTLDTGECENYSSLALSIDDAIKLRDFLNSHLPSENDNQYFGKWQHKKRKIEVIEVISITDDSIYYESLGGTLCGYFPLEVLKKDYQKLGGAA